MTLAKAAKAKSKAKAEAIIIKQLASNKSSLLLNIILQHTQTLQLNQTRNYLQK
jgi:hypothetical protein